MKAVGMGAGQGLEGGPPSATRGQGMTLDLDVVADSVSLFLPVVIQGIARDFLLPGTLLHLLLLT